MHVVMLPCVPIKMQGVGLLDFTLGSSTMCTDSSAQRTGVFLHRGTYAERSFERIIHNV